MLHFAELSGFGPWVFAIILVLALLVLLGGNYLLRTAREFRVSIADEVKRELDTAKEPSPMAVQQPLVVKPHDGLVSISQHQQLQDQFDALTEQRRKDVHGLHNKIEEGLEKVRAEIAAEFKELRETQSNARQEIAVLKSETAGQTRQLHALDGKIENLPEKILRLIKS